MIDKILQKRLAPVALRQQQLYLRQKLMISWLAAALLGFVLLLANMFGRWNVTLPAVLLSLITVGITVYFYLKSQNQTPDFKAIARYIEQHQPDMQVLLLTAVDQKPLTTDQKYNYLQERVIDQAVEHANQNNWLKVISNRKLEWANYGRWATGILFVFIASQLFPPISFVASDDVASADNIYRLLVNPGNAQIEQGAPVVITARFEGKVPSDATLVVSPSAEETERIPLTKSLDDPVYGTVIPQVDQNLDYWIEYDDHRSDDFLLSVYSYPELLRADAHIVYPDYADLEDKTVNDTRQISVLEGSRVDFTFKLNKPIVAAQLTVRDGSVLELTVDSDDPENYLVQIEPSQSQRYELQLIDADDRTNKVPPRITINVQKNMPPEIKSTFPNRDLEPSALEELAFEAEVWDDYGVTDYGLSYTVAGRETQDIAFDPQADENKKKVLSHVLELEGLGVEPDQLLTYYYWARDVGPDNNPRETASDLYFAEIRPFEEIFQESESRQDQQQQDQQQQDQEQQPQDQQAQQQNTQKMIELQKEIINATWNVKRASDLEHQTDMFAEDVGIIHESQAEVLGQAQEVLGGAEDPESAEALQQAVGFIESALEELNRAHDSDTAAPLMTALSAEQAAYQEFLTLREREFQVGRQSQQQQQQQQQQSQSSTSQRTQRQLDQLEMQQREDRYETERQATLNNDQQANQQENLQVQNRLSDLARRENDITERLKELQSELEEADEKQQEEIQRELKRLQEDQQQLLRDIDELQQQMNEPQNQQRMADANQQLSQTREDVQQAAEQMQQGELSRAITSATRAQNELEQIRDEFREQTSNQFSEQMRQMREQVQELDRNQQQIGEQIDEQIDPQQRSLTDSDELQQLIEQLQQQRESLEEILQQMREVSEQSEETEPILSRRLYDTLRQPTNNDLGRDLEVLEELLRQRFLPQAQEIQQQSAEDITELRQDIENAAESVLGSEADALRQARRQLDELIRQLEEEANQAQGNQSADQQQRDPSQQSANPQQGAPGEPGDPNQQGQSQQGQQQQGQQQGQRGQQQQGQRGQQQGQRGQQQQGQRGQQQQGQRGQRGQQQQGQRGQQQQGQNRQGQNQAGRGGRNQRSLTDPVNRDQSIEQFLNEFDNLGGNPNGPITGEDYLDWAERLRDVQEMLDDPEQSGELARIGELVRKIRNDVTRHGDEPQWDQVQNQVIKPMVEVYRQLGEELALIESDDALVPIDRDPVPQRFIDLVRNYYETLGKGKEEIKDKEEIK